MLFCLLIAAILGIASIFVFFGASFSINSEIVNDILAVIDVEDLPNMFTNLQCQILTQKALGVEDLPNMFDLSLGLNGWESYAGLTSLFVIEILIVIYCISTIVYILRNYQNDGFIILEENDLYNRYVVLGLMSFVSMILSFCTLPIIGLNDVEFISLGIGPIIYSIFQIIIIIMLVIGVIYHKTTEVYKKYKDPLQVYRTYSAPKNKNSIKESTNLNCCTNCGQPLDDDYVVCPNCGKSIVKDK